MSIRITSTRGKVLASGALLAMAAGAAGLGTFGSFTSTTSASSTASAGTVTIGLGADGTANNRLSVAATNIVPGDTISRAVTLTNSGSANLASVVLQTTATGTANALTTDSTNGLQLQINSCSQAWTEAGTASSGYTYTCGGSTKVVLASTPVITNSSLSNLSSLTAGSSDYLVTTLTFPTGADNSFQGLSSTVKFTFTGNQRTATTR